MSDHRSLEIDRRQRKLGPIWLSPGIMPRNIVTLMFASAMAIGFVNLINLIQPLILQAQLGMVEGEGDFTANLYIVAEIVTLLVAAPLANLSDIVGRRPIFTTGFLVVCLSLVLLPGVSTGAELMLIRVGTSFGIACCTTMIASLAADYPQNASRGKYLGINGLFTAVGVVVVGSGLTQLPRVFTGMGYATGEAISFTLWIGSALAFITAVTTLAGIKKGRAAEGGDKPGFLDNARVGLKNIRGNPSLTLACGATALSRGDLTVLATFFSLWIQKAGATAGIEDVVASATASKLFGLTQLSMLCFFPVIAVIADRINRISNLCLAIAIAAVGYFALAVAPDPFNSPFIYLVVVLAGMGEAVMIVSVPALIGQEAPAHLRGAIIGVAATFGAVGIIVVNKIAGLIFDTYSYQGPFLFMTLLNSCMLVWAVYVRLRYAAPEQ